MQVVFPTLEAAHDLVRTWRRSDLGTDARYDIIRLDCDGEDLPWRVTKYWIGVTP
jgi:hypothetical protein